MEGLEAKQNGKYREIDQAELAADLASIVQLDSSESQGIIAPSLEEMDREEIMVYYYGDADHMGG